MRCSSDLRARVIACVKSGVSQREAARRYNVGHQTVHRWMKAEDPLSYQKPGPKGARKIDTDALAADVEARPDLTHKERAKHFGVSPSCIGYTMKKLCISRKKNDAVHAARHYEKASVST